MSRIDEIRKRCEAATPGPWYGEENCGVYTDAENNKPVFETGCGCCTSSTLTPSNAAFIAHARDDIPYLLSEVDHLQSEVERERKRAEAAEDLAKEADETLKKVQVLLEDAIKEAELMTGLVDPETKGGPDKKYLVVMKYASILEDEGLIPPEELSILWEAAEALRRKEADSDDH